VIRHQHKLVEADATTVAAAPALVAAYRPVEPQIAFPEALERGGEVSSTLDRGPDCG